MLYICNIVSSKEGINTSIVMKNLILISILALFMSACSFHSRQTKMESNRNEKENQSIEAKKIKEAQEKKVEDVKPILVKNEVSKVEKVLNKKINPNSFDADMKIIEESNLYDQLTCQSLRYSYNLIRQYSPNSWDITYRKALESSKEGSKSAKRIENIGDISKN